MRIPFLATKDSRNKSVTRVTKEIVAECLESELIRPLVQHRDQWMEQFSLEKIRSGKAGTAIYKNAIGRTFSLNQMLKEVEQVALRKATHSKLKKPPENSVARRLLAHYVQGLEQLVVQTVLADLIDENIVCYQYDGFSIEMPRHDVAGRMTEIEGWLIQRFPNMRIEWKILEPISPSA